MEILLIAHLVLRIQQGYLSMKIVNVLEGIMKFNKMNV